MSVYSRGFGVVPVGGLPGQVDDALWKLLAGGDRRRDCCPSLPHLFVGGPGWPTGYHAAWSGSLSNSRSPLLGCLSTSEASTRFPLPLLVRCDWPESDKSRITNRNYPVGPPAGFLLRHAFVRPLVPGCGSKGAARHDYLWIKQVVDDAMTREGSCYGRQLPGTYVAAFCLQNKVTESLSTTMLISEVLQHKHLYFS